VKVFVTNYDNLYFQRANGSLVDFLSDEMVKKYSGFISQIGIANPTVSLFSNDISAPDWVRVGVGTYTLTKKDAFPTGKTVPIDDTYTDQAGNLFKINRTSADVMTLLTYAATDTTVLADGILTDRFINIEIYS